MGLFKKTRAAIKDGALAQQISIYVEGRQRSLANYLNAYMVRFSKKRIGYALVIFCLVVGSYLLYILLDAFGAIH